MKYLLLFVFLFSACEKVASGNTGPSSQTMSNQNALVVDKVDSVTNQIESESYVYVPKSLEYEVLWNIDFLVSTKSSSIFVSDEQYDDSSSIAEERFLQKHQFLINRKPVSSYWDKDSLLLDTLVAEIVRNDTIIFREVYLSKEENSYSIDIEKDSINASKDSIHYSAIIKRTKQVNPFREYYISVYKHLESGFASSGLKHSVLDSTVASVTSPVTTKYIQFSVKQDLLGLTRGNLNFSIHKEIFETHFETCASPCGLK